MASLPQPLEAMRNLTHVCVMRLIAAIVIALSLSVSPATTQTIEDEGAGPRIERLSEATRDLLEFWFGQAGSELDELAEKLGPQLQALADKIGDLSLYHAPEVLPNGDIILRRKVPLVPDENGSADNNATDI